MFANKNNNQETYCSKTFISRVLAKVIKETCCSKIFIVACLNSSLRTSIVAISMAELSQVPWAPLEFVCKSRVESRVEISA